jgi:thiol-disulfide isomerase/thioredoxin
MSMLDHVPNSRRTFLREVGAAIAIPGLSGIVNAAGFGVEGRTPELNGAVGWLNSPPLSRKMLGGSVVLFNFWTYSCINSLRELPYIKAWAAKYKDAGLVLLCHKPPHPLVRIATALPSEKDGRCTCTDPDGRRHLPAPLGERGLQEADRSQL